MPEADSWNFCAQSGCPGMSAVAPLVRANRTLALGAIAICNLYSIATIQAAIIALFRVINRYVGNLPPVPGISRIIPRP